MTALNSSARAMARICAEHLRCVDDRTCESFPATSVALAPRTRSYVWRCWDEPLRIYLTGVRAYGSSSAYTGEVPYTPTALLYKLLLYPLLRLYWLVFRPDVLGVRCLVEYRSRVLLIRNPYGPMKWDLPGGGVRRGERPEDAVRREVLEEVGLSLTELRPLGRYTGTEYYAKDTVVSYYALSESAVLMPRRAEVYEEGWFEWERLPAPLSREAARIIELYRSSAASQADVATKRLPHQEAR